MAIIKTSLPAYVEQDNTLISKAVLGAKSANLFTLQTDVKGDTALNLLVTDVTLQDGSACGFTPDGNSTLSQRIINAKPLKVNMEWCEKDILGIWAQKYVKANAQDKELEFEKEFVEGVIAKVNESVEKMIYQGDSSNAGEFDGLNKILAAAGTVKVTAGATKWETVKKMYAALPEEAIADDTVILVSAGDFRGLVQELIAANLYHYNENDGAGEIYLPGTNVRVIAVNGLNGTNHMIAGRLSNIFYGTDMMNDQEKFDLWFSNDNRTFRLAIEFIAGVQVAFPDQIAFL